MESEVIKRDIPLPRGGTLEVEVTPKFLDVVASHFGLHVPQDVNDDHIRMYIWGAFKNAIDKEDSTDVHTGS